MMRQLFAVLLVVVMIELSAVSAFAAPASDEIIDMQQPDGSKISTRLRGDEYQSWTELVQSGHTIVHNRATGFWEYAEKNNDGSLRTSGTVVQQSGQNAPPAIPRGLKPPRDMVSEGQQNQFQQKVYGQRVSAAQSVQSPDISNAPAVGDWVPVPVSGQRKMLVVLVSFSDRAIATTPVSWYSKVFDTTTKSVARYYQDNSFATLNIVPAAHTQAGSPAGVVSVTLTTPHPNAGPSWSTMTSAQKTAIDKPWANAALLLLKNSGQVNFDAFDTNADGTLDPSELLIYFIAAGYEASAGGLTPSVWAHADNISAVPSGVLAGTKNLQHWAQNGEYYNATTPMPMGVICHELGHQLGGLPDLYDTSGNNKPMGLFSLMAHGNWGRDVSEIIGTTPTALDAWSREYLGWTAPQTPIVGATVYLPPPLTAKNAALKMIQPNFSTTEYFLAENRYPAGWDLGFRGYTNFGATWQGGLLITHIDISAGTQGSNDINKYSATTVTPGHQGVVVVPASTSLCSMLDIGNTCEGHANTLFYQGNNSNWGPNTLPDSNFYDGSFSTFSISNISLPSATAATPVAVNTLLYVELPRTGQNTCYDTSGNAQICGVTHKGQDGYYQKGAIWKNPRFTINLVAGTSTPDGTIFDKLTGLTWLTNANCTDISGGIDRSLSTTVTGRLTWLDALTWSNNLQSGRCGLSDNSVAGNWRLPNINELRSLADLQQTRPALPVAHPFTNVDNTGDYWSSVTETESPGRAWTFGMWEGGVVSYGKTIEADVIAVRGSSVNVLKTGQTQCFNDTIVPVDCAITTGQDGNMRMGVDTAGIRFTNNGDGTVTDNLTGLIWLRNADCTNGSGRSFASAIIATNGLAAGQCGLVDGSIAGDWRLPNRNELASLLNYDADVTPNTNAEILNRSGFINFQNGIIPYWSSSRYADTDRPSASDAWFISMGAPTNTFGHITTIGNTEVNFVTAVKDGNFLDINIIGTGTGVVSTAGISCPGTCRATFSKNAAVQVTAIPNWYSTLTSWVGCDSLTGSVCNVTINESKTVSANFTTNKLVGLYDTTTKATGVTPRIQPAYDYLANKSIQNAEVRALIPSMVPLYYEDLLFYSPINVYLFGGWDGVFATPTYSGFSTVSGSLRISNGKVTVKNLKIKP